MKLYATTTSERASKGQGGNKFLSTKINDENGKNIFVLDIFPHSNGFYILLDSSKSYFIFNEGGGYYLTDKQYQEAVKMLMEIKSSTDKGKRQKDEDYTNLKFYPHRGCSFIKK